jgi:hypothetical protein
MEAKDIHKEMLPMYGEHCVSRQEIHNWVQRFSEGRTSSKTTKIILRRRFSGTCETVGQVFKFVWRLC